MLAQQHISHFLRVGFGVMLRICACAFVGAAGQAFPAGLAPLLSKFRAGLAGLGDADDGATSELAKRAASDLGEKVAQARASELLAETASRVATNDVLHFKYVGACERDLRGCPSGWSENGSGLCSPSSGYDGPCVDVDISAFTPAQKDEFAVSCEVAWPCAPCITDFSACPAGWSPIGRLCIAPDSYAGLCSPVADFSGFAHADKAVWSASCAVRWPCARN